MKKMVSVLLVFCIALAFFVPVSAVSSDGKETFVMVKAPIPDTVLEKDTWRVIARYKDTKKPINLSASFNSQVYATIPIEYSGREIEAFVPEEIEFADYDGAQYEFHEMQRLAKTGVILGNEKGEAKPFDNVTRAEATAMVMRFLGLGDAQYMGDVRFEDVMEDDWFFASVMSAYSLGIIIGDSESTFSPSRDVTREEITVMVARALMYAKMHCPARSEITNIADMDRISAWAREAYEYIGQNYISDYDASDSETPVRVLNPKKAATRYDVAYIISNTTRSCQLYPSDAAVYFGFDKQMPIVDGSTSTHPFSEAVYSALFYNGFSHEKYPEKHSKSHESYKKLINGEVDMLFASVYPASDILELAKEKGVELELIPIAYDAMIFFTNADNSAEGLTKEQIRDIYVNNAYQNWSEVGGSDALLYPYCRNNDSGSHAQMEKHFLGENEIHEQIRKESTSTTMSNVLTDVMAAKTDNPLGFGLGYSIYYYFNNMDLFYDIKTNLKLLAIDGVHPTDETIADGTYPLANNTYIVLRADTPENSPARRMAEFMLTKAGQACVEAAGYGRLK